MGIKFVCLCGKHLKAHQEMAGRRTSCPACGATVGIPSLRPTQRGTNAEPMSIFRGTDTHIPSGPIATDPVRAEVNTPSAGLPVPAAQRFKDVTPEQVVVVQRRRPLWNIRKRRRLETRWYQSLSYASRHMVQWPILAGVLTLSTGSLILLLPRVRQPVLGEFGYSSVFWFALLLSVLALAHTCAFLNRVLTLAARGDVGNAPAPRLDIEQAIGSALQWAGIFFSGPAILFSLSAAYWIHCGDLTLLDWIILAELTIPAIGYWLIGLGTAVIENRVFVSPWNVLETARKLGRHFVVMTALAATIVCGHFFLAVTAFEQLHIHAVVGFGLLGLSISSGLYVATCFLRVFGLWQFRNMSSRRSTSRFPSQVTS